MVYFNWLGNWIKLDDNDIICGATPSYFVANKIFNELDHTCNFVIIEHCGTKYCVHISQLVWTES